ncbi:MAG: synthase sector subunit b [Myxococcaceae bacterium]|jgi:F-type H+-transporting ATPase subunit b|nr:synthase sector subunit b [Myxococcaceae bacterium]MEA2748797.1 F-type H+-transporting ATPase subunit b [Myxococcales bacterium]
MSLLAVSTSNLIDAAAEGAVTVDADLSLFVQLGFFVVLLFILKPTLFDPMMKLFEEREKRIEGTRNQATKTDIKSAKAKAKADAIVAKGREAGAAERETLRAEGIKREVELMTLVRAETAQTLERGRAETGSEADAARKQLRLDAHALGRDMAARVLGREVAS